MKILHYYIYTLFISQLAYSQVGVNTATPKSSLHDAGTLQVTKEIRVSSDNSVKGNAGTYGQILVSKGEGQSPTWENIQEITVMPVVSAIAQYSGSGVLTTNAETIFKFNTVPYLDNKSITYNNTTGEFTFLKAGYYRIYATSTSNSSGSVTAGQVRTMLDKNGILFLAKSSYHHELSRTINHSVAGLEHFDVNDKLTLKYFREAPHNVTSAYISIIHTGN